MKRFTRSRSLIATSALSLIAVISGAGKAHAQFIFTSTTAPSLGSKDAADLNFNGSYDASRDFTNNNTPGQTFTAGSTGSVYSVTVKGVGNAGYAGDQVYNGSWYLRLSTVSGSTLTGSTTYTFPAAQVYNSADASGTANSGYLTFDLPTAYAVTSGTTYAYDIYSQYGYYGFARDASHVGAGGAFNTGASGGFTSSTVNAYSPANVSRTFIANMTAPSTIVASSAAPAVTGATIAQTATGAAQNNNTDFSDNNTPGQSFTTGANPLGYSLNSITLLGRGSAGNGFNTGLWHLRISAFNGTTITPVGSYTFDPTSLTAANASSYLTFNLSGLTLNANTSYSYDLSSENGYYGFADATTAGANDIGSIGSYFNTGFSRSFDSQTATVTSGVQRTFYASLTAIGGTAAPEPSALALLASITGLFGVGLTRRQKQG